MLEAKQGFIPAAEEPVTTKFHSGPNKDFFIRQVWTLRDRSQNANVQPCTSHAKSKRVAKNNKKFL